MEVACIIYRAVGMAFPVYQHLKTHPGQCQGYHWYGTDLG